jgi:hypothetical protein
VILKISKKFRRKVIACFPFIRHRPHRKRRVQNLFYCCLCNRCRCNAFTKPLSSNNRGLHTQTDGRNVWSTPLRWVQGTWYAYKIPLRLIQIMAEDGRSSLRHYATSQKIAASNPEEFITVFNWPNPSSRIMALGLAQPLTKVSTSNLSGKKRVVGTEGWYHRHLWADCLQNVRVSTSHNTMGLHDLLQGQASLWTK